MVSIARFLSWLPNIRPVIAKRMILSGKAGEMILDEMHAGESICLAPLYLVGAEATRGILAAYHMGCLPMQEGKSPGRTARAVAYHQSDLFPPNRTASGKSARVQADKTVDAFSQSSRS
ncbi:MAG: hypothetical protein ACOYLK_17630 [Sphingomonas sp.]